MRWLFVSFVCLYVLACNSGDPTSEGPFGTFRPPATSISSGASAGSTGGDASDASGDPSPSSTGSAIDPSSSGSESSTSTDSPPDLGTPGPVGCLGKIDFLFVISNSPTMKIVKEPLLAALPGFIDSITSTFAAFDLHIMIVDTDDFFWVGDCTLCQEDCNEHGTPPQCGAAVHPCDETMGAGVTYPASDGATNCRCDLAGGNRYITSDEPDLQAAFACIAHVGHGGGSNQPTGDAMIAAISDDLVGPGGCNEGFLRDDALLVVTLIADRIDSYSIQPMAFWTDPLLDAKHGDADAIVVLGLSTDVDQPEHLCKPDEPGILTKANPIRLVTELLPHGAFESICVDDFVPFFSEAMAAIVERCEQMIPK